MNVESSMLRDAKELIVWASKLEARVNVEIHEDPPDPAQMEPLDRLHRRVISFDCWSRCRRLMGRTIAAANQMGVFVDQYGGAFARRPKRCSRH